MKSDAFSSRVGVVLAAAGGAVGLGNIWKYSCVGMFHNVDVSTANALFSGLAQSGWQSFLCSIVAVVCAAGILWIGVGKGLFYCF